MNPETNQLEIKSLSPDYSIGIFHYDNNMAFKFGLPFAQYGVVWKARFTSDNILLALLSKKRLRVLDIRSKEIIWETSRIIESEPNRDTLKWSPDNRYVVCNNNNLIEILDLNSKKEVTIDGHSQNIISLSFDTSGRYLVSIGFEREIKIWDLHKDCEEIYNYKCPFFSSFANYDSSMQELSIVMDTHAGSRLKDVNNINKQGRNIIRHLNIKNERIENLVLLDTESHYVKNMQHIRGYDMVFLDCDGTINVYDSKTGLKIDKYTDARKMRLDVNAKILSFVKQNKIEKYRIPSKEGLIRQAQDAFGAIELSDEVKYQYFIK